MDSTDDLKALKNWAIGIVGFSTTISAVLVQILHFPVEPTLLCVLGFAGIMLLVVYLINKSEQRQKRLLQSHAEESVQITKDFDKRLDSIDEILLDIQRSTLRTEMNDEIARHPENHDTILKMAEKYFCQLKSDWVQTSLFLAWVESEEKAGRKVHIPQELLNTVNARVLEE